MSAGDHQTIKKPVKQAGETVPLSFVVIVLLPLLWVTVPFGIRRRRIPRRVTWESIPRNFVPTDVCEHLESFDAPFAALGFQPLGYTCSKGEYITYDRSWGHQELGMVHTGWSCHSTHDVRFDYPIFEAVRTDGFCIVTTGFLNVLIDETNPALNDFLVLAGEKSLTRLAKLHELHLTQAKQTHPGEWRSFNKPEEIANWISEWSEREMLGHLNRKTYRIAPNDESIVQPTWRASLRWTFSNFPPMLLIIKWWRQRRMNAAIRKLETGPSGTDRALY